VQFPYPPVFDERDNMKRSMQLSDDMMESSIAFLSKRVREGGRIVIAERFGFVKDLEDREQQFQRSALLSTVFGDRYVYWDLEGVKEWQDVERNTPEGPQHFGLDCRIFDREYSQDIEKMIGNSVDDNHDSKRSVAAFKLVRNDRPYVEKKQRKKRRR